MLGIDRRAARYAWTVALTVLALCLVYLVRRTLFVLVLALLFAYLLSPLVNLLDRALYGNRTRGLALGLAYIIFLGVVVLIGSQIGSSVVAQATALGQKLPDLLENWQKASQKPASPANSLRDQILDRAKAEIASRSGDIVGVLSRAGLKALTAAGDLIYVVIIPILAFFFLKDAHVIRQRILDLVDEGPRRDLMDDVLADVHLLLARYIRALVLLSLATFTAYSVSFSIMGVPYAVLLAAVAGMLEFIPTLGPLAAGAAIVLVGAISGSSIVAILIFILAYRVFQDYILSPILMKQGMELHPLMVMFGVFAGAEVAGIAGAFLSVPVLALVRVMYERLRKARKAAALTPLRSQL
jgi:predicted PurR-regulated permease PerM